MLTDDELRENLRRLANRAVPAADTLATVRRGARRARRRLRIGSALAAVAVVAVVVPTTLTLDPSAGHDATVRPATSASPSATTSPQSTASTQPRYLPSGATLVRNGPIPLPSNAVTEGQGGPTESMYQLAGGANANTIPPGGVTAANNATVHPATDLSISFVPGVRTLPPIPSAPPAEQSSKVTIAGWPALLSTPSNGLGTYRIDWVDDDGYHVVTCQRITSPDGLSGLSQGELLKIAASMYAH